ncbi:MAG TPA: hypothetical protein PLC65_02825 [Bacteroidia bacterium]|nr:hypothetical protein [Bacteroidia bacterium]HRD37543.1 hypothetical protein [Bacteroidia bacterium]
MSVKKQITRTAEISIDKQGFLRFKIIEGSVIDEEDALDNLLVIKTISENKKMLKLIDLRGKWKMTKKAHEVSEKNVSAKNTIARAYIIDGFLTKLLLKFFRSFSSSDCPQEFFTDEEEAILWLKKQF